MVDPGYPIVLDSFKNCRLCISPNSVRSCPLNVSVVTCVFDNVIPKSVDALSTVLLSDVPTVSDYFFQTHTGSTIHLVWSSD